jgi:hypothetical protein
MKKLSYIKYILSKVKYLFEINITYMGSVIDLNDWRINSMQGSVCAIAGCPNNRQISVQNVQLITALNM